MGFPCVSVHIKDEKKSGKDAQGSDNKENHPVPPNGVQSCSHWLVSGWTGGESLGSSNISSGVPVQFHYVLPVSHL